MVSLLAIIMMIVAIVMAVIVTVIAVVPVVATNVLTVDPLVVASPMSRRPSHLPVIIPVGCAAIERLIADLDVEAARAADRRNKSADKDDGCD
jgi:hypothetical protein